MPQRIGPKSPKWTGHGDISGSYFVSLQHAAARRSITFAVTIEEMWNLYLKQERQCALSGLPISFTTGRVGHGRKGQTASLDRRDQSLGYVKGNVQWVHKAFNLAKGHFDEEIFLMVCNLVAQTHPREGEDLDINPDYQIRIGRRDDA